MLPSFCPSQYGNVFTLRILGQKMTFLLAPEAYAPFFTAPVDQISFGPAVKQVLLLRLRLMEYLGDMGTERMATTSQVTQGEGPR